MVKLKNLAIAIFGTSITFAAGGAPIPDLQMKDAVKEHLSPPSIADIVAGYVGYVMKPGEHAMLESLKKSLNDPAFTQEQINNELISAARHDCQAVVEMLLNRLAGQLGPDQEGIDMALQHATENGHYEMVKLLKAYYVMKPGEESWLKRLQIILNGLAFDQSEINVELDHAVASGYQAVVEFLLNPPSGQLAPNQEGIDRALRIAAGMGDHEIVKLLKDYHPEGAAAGAAAIQAPSVSALSLQ